MASPNPQVMVDMVALQELLNAAHEWHEGKHQTMHDMLWRQANGSNPITKLRNQYNAAVDLYHTPADLMYPA